MRGKQYKQIEIWCHQGIALAYDAIFALTYNLASYFSWLGFQIVTEIRSISWVLSKISFAIGCTKV